MWIISLPRFSRQLSTNTTSTSAKMMKGEQLSLAHFIQRSAALHLWRLCLRSLKRVPDKITRTEMTHWARTQFEAHRHERDLDAIKFHISRGRRELEMTSELLSRSGLR
ncbi:uncharacterized protein V1516DRAFT_664960 [Lipomyces oligophaga]|uniref:uncharacterized protein n=1 Tax=Lipomyces oligophaga TaxID=45792 RepID=UPI0034CD794B